MTPPRIVITLPLEGTPELLVYAETLEDERRLRSWLRRRPLPLRGLPDAVRELLDLLDELDERQEAA